ncbi:uncharacterized protein LOC144144132 [Haemaphysalis longicornis]
MKCKACFWPPDSRSAEQLAKSASSPKSDWQLVPCTQLQSFSTYEQARKKLRRAEDTSDLESEMDLGRGKKKKKQVVQIWKPLNITVERTGMLDQNLAKREQKVQKRTSQSHHVDCVRNAIAVSARRSKDFRMRFTV